MITADIFAKEDDMSGGRGRILDVILDVAKQKGTGIWPDREAKELKLSQCARLPSNLIHAQRDYFGAHTYERIDLSGTSQTKWMEK